MHGTININSYLFVIHIHCLILLDSSQIEWTSLKLTCIESLSLVCFFMLSQLQRLGLFIVYGIIIINDKIRNPWKEALMTYLKIKWNCSCLEGMKKCMEISSQASRLPDWEILLNTPSRTNCIVGNFDNRLQNKQRLLLKDPTLISTLLTFRHRASSI